MKTTEKKIKKQQIKVRKGDVRLMIASCRGVVPSESTISTLAPFAIRARTIFSKP